MRPTLTTGVPGAVGEHDRHLQDDLQLVPDAVGREVVERLGAVAGLEQEGLPGRHFGQRLAQCPGLAGEHERGQRRKRLQGLLEVRARPATPVAARPGRRRQEVGVHSFTALNGGRRRAG